MSSRNKVKKTAGSKSDDEDSSYDSSKDRAVKEAARSKRRNKDSSFDAAVGNGNIPEYIITRPKKRKTRTVEDDYNYSEALKSIIHQMKQNNAALEEKYAALVKANALARENRRTDVKSRILNLKKILYKIEASMDTEEESSSKMRRLQKHHSRIEKRIKTFKNELKAMHEVNKNVLHKKR